MKKNKIRTKGKDTDRVIAKILLDIYKDNVLFDKLSDILKLINSDSNPLLNVFEKYVETDEDWNKFVDQNLLNQDQWSEASDMMSIILGKFNGNDVMDISSFTHQEITIKDITDNYDISRPTIDDRLPKYFNTKKRKAGKTYKTIFIPRLDILISIVLFFFLKKQDDKRGNDIIDLYKIFDSLDT